MPHPSRGRQEEHRPKQEIWRYTEDKESLGCVIHLLHIPLTPLLIALV